MGSGKEELLAMTAIRSQGMGAQSNVSSSLGTNVEEEVTTPETAVLRSGTTGLIMENTNVIKGTSRTRMDATSLEESNQVGSALMEGLGPQTFAGITAEMEGGFLMKNVMTTT